MHKSASTSHHLATYLTNLSHSNESLPVAAFLETVSGSRSVTTKMLSLAPGFAASNASIFSIFLLCGMWEYIACVSTIMHKVTGSQNK